MLHQNGNSPSSSPGSVSSYIGSPGPSGVIQPTIMPIFQPNPCIAPRTDIMLPYLHILNQPQSKFRFRYASEMTGTHGCLMAESRDRNKKECIRVQLFGCMESEAIVRCTLVTNSKDPVPHVHKLGGDGQNVNNDGEYQDIVVSASKNDWVATFSGLTIIHTAKKQVRDVVERRLLNEKGNIQLSRNQGQQLKDEADKIAITMDLHSVKLKFQAYVKRHDRLEPISRPAFSQAIHNLKSTHAGDLRIVRIDKVYSCCTGQEEIFIFVEKVNKKDIKIKFFETDDNEEETWSAYADFSELDVHHQYAIAFKTPPYRDQNIEEAVNVWFQLYRPSNGSTSAPKAFTYTPRETVARKRPRTKSIVNIPGPSDSDIGPSRRPMPGQSHKQVPLLPPIDPNHSGGGPPSGVTDASFTFDWGNLKEEDFSMSFFSPMQMPPSNVPSRFPTGEFSWSTEPIVQNNFQPGTTNQLPNIPLQNQYVIPPQDAFAVFDEIANELPERAFTDISTLLEQGNWMDYEGSYAVDASIVSADPSQARDQQQIKNRNGETLPSHNAPIADSSLTRTSMLTNYILRMAAALRMYAGSGDTTHILNRFLHLMAMEDDNGDNALHCAIAHDQLDVAHHILKTVPNNDYGLRFVNAFNNAKLTPLHICVKKNLTELIPPLLNCGANPFLPNASGDNVIHVAASKKNLIEGLRLLLELGVAKERKSKLNARNYAGFSPLHLAIRDTNPLAVDLLLTHGSNVNLVEAKSGKSPLHLAVQQRSKDIVVRLLREPALEINAQSYDGNTALHLAVMEDLPEICQLFSDAGADPNIVNFIQQSVHSDDDADVSVDRNVSENNSESTSKGITALDLASLNASVLEILKLSKDPPSSAKEFVSPTASDTNSCFTDSGFDVSESRELSKELSTDLIRQLASYLDTPSKGWEKLADSLELLSSVRLELDKQPSPTIYLLSNLDLWDIPSHVVLEKLHLLQFKQAAKLLEDYLGL